MRVLVWLIGGLLALFMVLFGLQLLASERVEVIEVHVQDELGTVVTTRLWVVDYQQDMYVRVGADGSGWFARMQASPAIEVTRGEVRKSFKAIPRPDLSVEINALMQDKYTWGDTFIGLLFGGREGFSPD